MDCVSVKHIVDFYFNHRRGILPNTEYSSKVTLAPKTDLTQVTTLNEKVWGSAAKLNWTSGKSFEGELWNCEQWQTVLRNSACN